MLSHWGRSSRGLECIATSMVITCSSILHILCSGCCLVARGPPGRQRAAWPWFWNGPGLTGLSWTQTRHNSSSWVEGVLLTDYGVTSWDWIHYPFHLGIESGFGACSWIQFSFGILNCSHIQPAFNKLTAPPLPEWGSPEDAGDL